MRRYCDIDQSHLHGCTNRKKNKEYLKFLSKHHFFVKLYNYDTLKAAVHIFGEKSFAMS